MWKLSFNLSLLFMMRMNWSLNEAILWYILCSCFRLFCNDKEWIKALLWLWMKIYLDWKFIKFLWGSMNLLVKQYWTQLSLWRLKKSSKTLKDIFWAAQSCQILIAHQLNALRTRKLITQMNEKSSNQKKKVSKA